MFDDRGAIKTEAPPATPVEVLGLQGVPQAGDTFQVVSDIDRAQTIATKRQIHTRNVAMLKTTKRGIESLGLAEVKELLVLLKADVQGSVEVLKSTLEKLSTEKVKVRVIRSGVGAITESDVLLASATQADQASTAVVIILMVRFGAVSTFGKYLLRTFSANSLVTEFDGTDTSAPSRRNSSMTRLVSCFKSRAKS